MAAITTGIVLAQGGAPGHGDGPGEADAKPSVPAQAGTLGDARAADPCALLDAASLSRFGDARLDPDYGELERCDVLLQSSGGDDTGGVEVGFESTPDDFGGSVPTRRVGNVRIASMERDGDECLRFLATPDHRQIVVVGKREGAPAPDPCALADAATDHAVGVLDKGPVPTRSAPWPVNSPARLDACRLLGAGGPRRVAGLEDRPPERGFGSWSCAWESRDGEGARVEVQFTRDNDVTDNGVPTPVAGTTGYLAPEEDGDGSCVAYTPHRTYTNAMGDRTVEMVRLAVSQRHPAGGSVCDTAEALSATVVRNIAKSFPVR